MNDGLTAKGKHPKTRAEAMFAFEAAVLELSRHLDKRSTVPKTNKPFWKSYNKSKLWLVAVETRANRDEVVVVSLRTGQQVVLSGVSGMRDISEHVLLEYQVLEQYPQEREKQLEVVQEERAEQERITRMREQHRKAVEAQELLYRQRVQEAEREKRQGLVRDIKTRADELGVDRFEFVCSLIMAGIIS